MYYLKTKPKVTEIEKYLKREQKEDKNKVNTDTQYELIRKTGRKIKLPS